MADDQYTYHAGHKSGNHPWRAVVRLEESSGAARVVVERLHGMSVSCRLVTGSIQTLLLLLEVLLLLDVRRLSVYR